MRAFALARMIPVGCEVMTVRLPFIRRSSLGCDGRAAP